MIDVKLDGLDKILKNLNKKKFDKAKMRKALNKSALLVQRDAKQNCAVDTGHLRASIVTEVHDDYAIVGTNVKYAPYVEFGTGLLGDQSVPHTTRDSWSYQTADGEWHTSHGQRPQPFLIPALKNNEQNIMKIMKEVINE